MKKIIITLLMVLSFTGNCFATQGFMEGKVSGRLDYTITTDSHMALVRCVYDEYSNIPGIKVDGRIDMLFITHLTETGMFVSIKIQPAYWAVDGWPVGVLSIIFAQESGPAIIYHIEAIEKYADHNVPTFVLASKKDNTDLVLQSYGYWNAELSLSGEPSMEIANFPIFFQLLF